MHEAGRAAPASRIQHLSRWPREAGRRGAPHEELRAKGTGRSARSTRASEPDEATALSDARQQEAGSIRARRARNARLTLVAEIAGVGSSRGGTALVRRTRKLSFATSDHRRDAHDEPLTFPISLLPPAGDRLSRDALSKRSGSGGTRLQCSAPRKKEGGRDSSCEARAIKRESDAHEHFHHLPTDGRD